AWRTAESVARFFPPFQSPPRCYLHFDGGTDNTCLTCTNCRFADAAPYRGRLITTFSAQRKICSHKHKLPTTWFVKAGATAPTELRRSKAPFRQRRFPLSQCRHRQPDSCRSRQEQIQLAAFDNIQAISCISL